MHAAGQGVERLVIGQVDGERGVASPVLLDAGPLGGSDDFRWAFLDHVPVDARAFHPAHQIHHVRAHALSLVAEAFFSNRTIGHTGEVQNHLCCLDGVIEIRAFTGGLRVGAAVHQLQFLHLTGDIIRRAVGASSQLLRQWTQVRPLLVDLRVIALDRNQLGHVLAWLQPIAVEIWHDAVGHAQLIRRIMPQGCSHDIRLRTQPLLGQ